MRTPSLLLVVLALGWGPVLGCRDNRKETLPPQVQVSEQQQVVDQARVAVQALRTDSVVGSAVNSALTNARGVLIFPALVKAGLVVGAAGGTGVLLGRVADGWSDPAFYLAGEGSFGLQIGATAAQVIFIVRNDGALQKIVNGNVTLGVDVSAAAGPVGVGVGGGVTPNIGADLVAYSVQEGVFGGAALQAGVIAPRLTWNEAYYGTGATPRAIVIENRFRNPGAVELKRVLAIGPVSTR
jgi:lipid-binding SYLF domain-containing protein